MPGAGSAAAISGNKLGADLVALFPGILIAYMSAHSGDVIAHEGILDDGVLIERIFSADVLLRPVRSALDGVRPSIAAMKIILVEDDTTLAPS